MSKEEKPQPEPGKAKVSQGKPGRRRKGMCLEDRPLLEPHAGGIDIGAREIFVAVLPDREHVVTFGLEHRVLGQIDAIGVDEIQYAKGHRYLTLVYQIDLGVTRLLWVGRERTIESFQGFFTVIGDELASKIVFVCSDMWEPYLKVIREKCSEALHILDRFHVVAKMNKALDEIRAENRAV